MSFLNRVNSGTIAQLFLNSLKIIYKDDIQYNKILLVITDAAPYMKKAFRKLSIFFPKMLYVNCFSHNIHGVCETTRKISPIADKSINNIKKVFKKSPLREGIFKDTVPNIPLPPSPTITRWGTWINACVYSCKYYEELKLVFNKINNDDSICVNNCQNLLEADSSKNELLLIGTYMEFILKYIIHLQQQDLSLNNSIKYLKEIKVKLIEIPGEFGTAILNSFNEKLNKNTGLKELIKIENILRGGNEEISISYTQDELRKFRFAPITSNDVERSFSLYKDLLRDKRRSFKEETLEYLLVIKFNVDVI